MNRKFGRSNKHREANEIRAMINSAPVPAGVVDHGSLGGLADDDHTQYVHLSAARTITAQHSFSPTTPAAPFVLGANAQNQMIAGFYANRAADLDRSINVGAGLSGGGQLNADRSISIDLTYSFTWSGLHTFNAGARIAAGQNLQFGTDVALTRYAADVLSLASGDAFRSSGFTSGVSGWSIAADGSAEFQNVLVRGELRSTVFVKGLIEARAGSSITSYSAGMLAADMSVPSSSTWPMIIKNPPGGGFLFAINDRLRVKAEYSGGIADVWFYPSARVDNLDGTQTYTCNWQSGTRPVVIAAGAVCIDYGGTSGAGLVSISADNSIGASANISIMTHAGSPWSALSLVGRIGNMNGSFGATVDRWGFGFGDYSGGNFISYNAEAAGKFKIRFGTNGFQIDDNGLFVKSSASYYIGYVTDLDNPLTTKFADIYGNYSGSGLKSFLVLRASMLSGAATSDYSAVSLSALPVSGFGYESALIYAESGRSGQGRGRLRISSRDLSVKGGVVIGDSAGTIEPQLDGSMSIYGYISKSSPYAFRAYRTTNQSIANNSTTVLQLTSASDSRSMFNTGTYRGTVATNQEGWYLITASMEFAATNTTGQRAMTVYKNGTTPLVSDLDNSPSASYPSRLNAAALVYMSAGDYIDLRAYQNSGVAINSVYNGDYSPFLAATRIA